MATLNYCLDCRRIFSPADQCTYCKSTNVKALTKKAPVNVIGSKIKGRVLKIKDNQVHLLYKDQNKDAVIKEFDSSKLRKIL